METHATCNCTSGAHDDCEGYVAPLVYSSTRPCSCDCHAMRGRDFAAAQRSAERSYYGQAYYPEPVPRWSATA